MVERLRNVSVAVGTANVQMAEEIFGDALRTVLVVTNTSTAGQIITLSPDKDATVGEGIVLYPTGSWMESIDNKFTPTQKRIFAKASAAAGTLAVHERITSGEVPFRRG